MRSRLPIIALCLFAAAARGGEDGEIGRGEIVGFDGRTFEYAVEDVTVRGGVERRVVRFPSPVESPFPVNNQIHLEYFRPAGHDGAPRPTVVILHVMDASFWLERHLCLTLAKRGIPAAWFPLPYYSRRQPEFRDDELFRLTLNEFLDSYEQGLADARRVIDYLAAQPEVDAGELGLWGTSLGAILAVPLLEREPRLGRAALFLGGGGLARILGHSPETAWMRELRDALEPDDARAFDAMLDRLEPTAHAGRLAELAAAGRAVLIFAGADEVIAPARADELLAAIRIGRADQAVMTLPGVNHYTALLRVDEVIRRALPVLAAGVPPPPAPTPPGPYAIFGRAVDGLARDLLDDPAAGTMNRWRLVNDKVNAEGDDHGESLTILRGPDGRFAVTAASPGLGAGVAGFGRRDGGLWIVTPFGLGIRLQTDGRTPKPGDGDAVWTALNKTGAGAKIALPAAALRMLRDTPELAALFGMINAHDDGRMLTFRFHGAADDAVSLWLDDDGGLASLAFDAMDRTFHGRVERERGLPFDEEAFNAPFTANTNIMPPGIAAPLFDRLLEQLF